MNERFQKVACYLERMMAIQKDSISPGSHQDYMLGMYNGMAYVQSLINNEPPRYLKVKRKFRKCKIRHKGCKG